MPDPGDLETYEEDTEREEEIDLDHVVCSNCFAFRQMRVAMCGTPITARDLVVDHGTPVLNEACVVCFSGPLLCHGCGLEVTP